LCALHGYQTIIKTFTIATLYSLVYGMEVVMPLKVKIYSLRVLKEKKKLGKVRMGKDLVWIIELDQWEDVNCYVSKIVV